MAGERAGRGVLGHGDDAQIVDKGRAVGSVVDEAHGDGALGPERVVEHLLRPLACLGALQEIQSCTVRCPPGGGMRNATREM